MPKSKKPQAGRRQPNATASRTEQTPPAPDERVVASDLTLHELSQQQVGAMLERVSEIGRFDDNRRPVALALEISTQSGLIITRCDELQKVFDHLGKGSSYGRTTTILSLYSDSF